MFTFRLHHLISSLPFVEFTYFSSIVSELDRIASWQFDIFSLTSSTQGWPLIHVAYHLFESYGLIDRLDLNRHLLCNFLVAVEHGSNINGNFFHSSVHAADMLQVCARFGSCVVLLNESAIAYAVSSPISVSGSFHSAGVSFVDRRPPSRQPYV
jgi:hypothetical protein